MARWRRSGCCWSPTAPDARPAPRVSTRLRHLPSPTTSCGNSSAAALSNVSLGRRSAAPGDHLFHQAGDAQPRPSFRGHRYRLRRHHHVTDSTTRPGTMSTIDTGLPLSTHHVRSSIEAAGVITESQVPPGAPRAPTPASGRRSSTGRPTCARSSPCRRSCTTRSRVTPISWWRPDRPASSTKAAV